MSWTVFLLRVIYYNVSEDLNSWRSLNKRKRYIDSCIIKIKTLILNSFVGVKSKPEELYNS